MELLHLTEAVRPDDEHSDWIKANAKEWPWPGITSADAMREELKRRKMPVKEFRKLTSYRAWVGRVPWLEEV